MATATADRPTCSSIISLTIAIQDVRYSVDPIDPGECGTVAFRLHKRAADHATYDVLRDHFGIVSCTCPDFEFRHRSNGNTMCKHGTSLVGIGLMPAPVGPAPADEPAPCLACTPAPAEAIPGEPADPFPADWVAPGDVEDDPEPWPDGCDDHTWNLGPDPADDPRDAPTLDLPALVDAQADAYRAWPLEAGAMIANALDELALKIRLVDATTPADYAARADVLDRDARESWYRVGFDAGLAEGRCEPAGSAFGHQA